MTTGPSPMRTRPIPDAVLADVLDRLGIAVAAGIDLRRAVASEAGRVPARWRSALKRVAAALADGTPLAEALAGADGAFPPVVLGMVAVGDRTGHDAETLAAVAADLRETVKARREFRAGLIGPALRLVAAVAVVGVLILVSGIARGLDGRPLDLVGLGLRGPAGLAIYAVVLLAIVAGAWFAWPPAARSWRNRGLVHRVGAALPLVGPAAAAAEAARWCRAASLAAHAGIDAGRLVTLASRAAPGLAVDPREVERRLRAGDTLAEALAAAGRLPPRVLDAVATGELSGTTAETLARLVPDLEADSRRGFAAAAAAAGFAAWAAVAVLIVLIVFRLAAEYAGIIEDAGRPIGRGTG